MIALSSLKYTLSIRSSLSSMILTSCCVGQPALSTGPLSLGQLSTRSATVSPSLSGSGQPWLATGPALIGQRSATSSTPSLSLSGSGQPSSSSKLSLSSGSLAHLST